MMRQPELIMASVTKALTMTSNSTVTTLGNARRNAQTIKIEEQKLPERNQQLVLSDQKLSKNDTTVNRAKTRINHKGNFLSFLQYSYSECEDQVVANYTSQGRSTTIATRGLVTVAMLMW